MKNLLKKYFEMTNEEKEKLEDLYILDSIQNAMADSEIYVDFKSLESLVDIVKELLVYANISLYDLIDRLLNIIEAPDKSIKDIKELDLIELIELLTENDSDFDYSYLDAELIKEFQFEDFKCSLSKSGKRYVIIYEKQSNVHVIIFNDFEDMLCSLVEYNISKEEQNIE